MRRNFGAKPWTYPQPVFIIATYGEDGTPDAMNAAWGGISDFPQGIRQWRISLPVALLR